MSRSCRTTSRLLSPALAGWLVFFTACRPSSSASPREFADWRGADGAIHRVTEENGERVEELTLRDAGSELMLEARGRVEIAANDRDFVLHSPGASMTLRHRSASGDRTWRRASGEPAHYAINGHAAPFDDAARGWLSSCIETLVRDTTFGAQARAERLFQHGGCSALLGELEVLRSAQTKAVYVKRLANGENASAADVAAALEIIQQAGFTSSTRKELCLLATSVAPADRALTRALIEATRPLSSTGDRSEVLAAVATQRTLDVELAGALIDQVRPLPSMSARTELLLATLAVLPEDERLLQKWLEAVEGLGSSDAERVLQKLLERPSLSAAMLLQVAKRSALIASDSTRGRILCLIAKDSRADEPVLEQVLTLGASCGSSDAGRVMMTVLERETLSLATAERVAHSSRRISSSSERERVHGKLIEILLQMRGEKSVAE